jgi:hypothetical protein
MLRTLLVVSALFVSCTEPTVVAPKPAAPPPGEAESTALLNAFEKSGLSVERNGKVLGNAEATKWFRRKWARRKASIQTGEDFILRVVHHSSATKQPYQVVRADGTKEPSADWFTARLKELRKP